MTSRFSLVSLSIVAAAGTMSLGSGCIVASTEGKDAGSVCGTTAEACTTDADCCAGFACSNKVCLFVGGIGGGTSSTSSGAGTSGGTTAAASSGASGAATSAGGSSGNETTGGEGTSGTTGIGTTGFASTGQGGSSGTSTGGGTTQGGSTGGSTGGTTGSTCGCTAAGQLCTAAGTCVACLGDSDCAASPAGAHCDARAGSTTFGMCVACTASSQCAAGQVCDPAQSACVSDCRVAGAAACVAPTPTCSSVTGACVACLNSANCSNGLLCNTTNFSCVQCLGPSDCSYDAPGCAYGMCNYCLSPADCPANDSCAPSVFGGGTCYCTSDLGCGGDVPTCVTSVPPGLDLFASGCGCTANSQCGAVAAGETCSPEQPQTSFSDVNGVCIPPCTADPSLCQPNVCNPATGLCQQCVVNTDCPDAGQDLPYCSSGGLCVQCTVDSECAGDTGLPRCSSAGLCVQCLVASDCPPAAPGCNSGSDQCGSCTQNADCPAGDGCTSGSTCAGFCGLNGLTTGCAPCTSNADCAGATCNTSTGFCG